MKKSLLFYLPTTSLAIDRAQQIAHRSKAALFKEWFAIDVPLPEGALVAFAENLIQSDAHSVWCRMALRPYIADHRQVHLSTESVSLSDDEYEKVFHHLKEWLQADGLFLYQQNREWLCRIDNHSNVHMSFDTLMPQGSDSAFWHRLLTECQMLLSQIGIANTLLHCWGIGTLPQKLKRSFSKIYSNNSVMQGLAKCAEISFESWVPSFDFEEILADLQQGKISDIYFVTIDAEYQLKRKHYYYFWRGKNGISTRTKPINADPHLIAAQR